MELKILSNVIIYSEKPFPLTSPKPPECSFQLHSSSSRHTVDPQGRQVPVLFHHSTEQIPKTSVAYLYDFEQIGADFSCAFGSVVVVRLEVRYAFSTCLTVQLKPQCLLPPSLAAGLLQSLKGFSEPAFSEIWLQPLIAFFSAPSRQCNHCSFNFELANYASNCVSKNIYCLQYLFVSCSLTFGPFF